MHLQSLSKSLPLLFPEACGSNSLSQQGKAGCHHSLCFVCVVGCVEANLCESDCCLSVFFAVVVELFLSSVRKFDFVDAEVNAADVLEFCHGFDYVLVGVCKLCHLFFSFSTFKAVGQHYKFNLCYSPKGYMSLFSLIRRKITSPLS